MFKYFIFIRFLIISVIICFFLGCGRTVKLHNSALHEISIGNYERAIALYQEILSSEKDNAFYLNNLGWTYFRNDNFDDARTTLEKAKSSTTSKSLLSSIELSLFMVTTFEKGREFLQNGSCLEAIAEFDKVASKYETKELALKYYALCYEKMAKNNEAKQKWEEIIKIYSGSKIKNKFYHLALEKLSQ